MNKPSQYLIDKTENEQISKFLKQQINKSNIKLMNAKTKTFQHLNTLTPYSDVANPFEHSVVENEVKTLKEEKKSFTKPPQVNVQVTEAQKVLKESEQKQHKIVNDMAGILHLDKIEHDLTGIRIKQKREAQFIRDQIYFRPTQFEIDKKNEQQHKFITEEYTTEEGLDFMDNRVPKRVVELEKLQSKIFEGKKHGQKGISNSNVQQSKLSTDIQAGNGVIVQDPALITKPKIEVKEEIDALDVNLHHPILKTVTKELIHQAHILSPTKTQFIQGKCICDCHKQANFEGRVCLKCMCKHDEQDKQQNQQQHQFGSRVNNFNLLQDVQIPMYKQQQQSILKYEGEITNNVINQMIDEQFAHISPNKQIQAVSDQVCNMSNKMWSVALRSDVSPHMTIDEMQNMLNKPSNLGLQIEKEFTLQDQYEVINKSYQDIVQIQKTKDKKIQELNSKAINQDIEQQMLKNTRNISMAQIVAMRKKNNDSVLSIIKEQTASLEPLTDSLVKQEYLHERLEKQKPIQKHNDTLESPQKRINYLNHNEAADSQIAALKSFASPFRKPPGCLQMIEGTQFMEQTNNNSIPQPENNKNDIQITEETVNNEEGLGITLGTLGGDTNAIQFIPLSPTVKNRSGRRANSPIHRKEIISRQNQEMKLRLQHVQSRVNSPSRQQIISDHRIDELMEKRRIQTQEKLVKLVQETNMNKDEIRDMMRRTHKKLVQIDKKATKNAKTISPIDFKVLYGRKHGFD